MADGEVGGPEFPDLPGTGLQLPLERRVLHLLDQVERPRTELNGISEHRQYHPCHQEGE